MSLLGFNALGHLALAQVSDPPAPTVAWESTLPPLLQAPRASARGAAISRSSLDPDNVLIIVQPYDWDLQPFQPPHPSPERRSAATMRGDEGTEAPQPLPFLPPGWEVQSVQPQHPAPERRAAAVLKGDDGTQAILPNVFAEGWRVQEVQPPHPRPERSGALMLGDTTAIPSPIFFPAGWEVQSVQPPHPAPERRAAAIMRGDEGTEAILPVFFPAGWEVAPFQPPHRGVERSAAIMAGDAGIQAPFVLFVPTISWQPENPNYRWQRFKSPDIGDRSLPPFVAWVNVFPAENPNYYFFRLRKRQPEFGDQGTQDVLRIPPIAPEVQPPIIPARRRTGADMRGADGIDAPFFFFTPFGWPIQPVQPPHKVFKSPTIGHAGIEATLVQFTALEWPSPWAPPRYPARPERFAAVAVGDSGTQQITFQFFPAGWEPTLFLLRRIKRESAAAHIVPENIFPLSRLLAAYADTVISVYSPETLIQAVDFPEAPPVLLRGAHSMTLQTPVQSFFRGATLRMQTTFFDFDGNTANPDAAVSTVTYDDVNGVQQTITIPLTPPTGGSFVWTWFFDTRNVAPGAVSFSIHTVEPQTPYAVQDGLFTLSANQANLPTF